MSTNNSTEQAPYLKIPLVALNNDLEFLMKFIKLRLEKNADLRFIINGDIALKKQDFPKDFFTYVVGMEGDIYIESNSLESFGSLEFVVGRLMLSNLKNLKSLGGLKEVDGDLFCVGSSIESLGDLKVVKGRVKLKENLQLRSLGSLEQVGDEFELTGSPIKSLGSLKRVGCEFLVTRTLLSTDALAGIEVGGKIHFNNEAEGDSVIIPYRFLGNDWNQLQEYLMEKGNPRYVLLGNLDLSGRRDIQNLNNIVKVVGNLILDNTSIESLGELGIVEGNMRVRYNKRLKSLGKLEFVKKSLDLSYTLIESLGNLKSVKNKLSINGARMSKSAAAQIKVRKLIFR
jgi:hypothetical protein